MTGDEGMTGYIDRDAGGFVKVASTKEGGVDEGCACGVQFGDEGILRDASEGVVPGSNVGGLKGVRGDWEIRRRCVPGDIGIAVGVDGDAGETVELVAAAAEVGTVEGSRTGGG